MIDYDYGRDDYDDDDDDVHGDDNDDDDDVCRADGLLQLATEDTKENTSAWRNRMK